MKLANRPNAVMLFAAGFGTRMGALSAHKPKPLIEVNGRALIDHTLDLVDEIEPNTIVANLHYKPELLADHLASKNVNLSYEQPEILETGGGLRAALPMLGIDPVFTMNTDAIWKGPNPLLLLLDQWDPENMDALLMCVSKQNAVGHIGQGDFDMDKNGRISRGNEVIYGGVQIIKTDKLASISESVFSLNLLWNDMVLSDRLFASKYPGKWCDVGYPEGIKIAESLLNSENV